MSATYALLTEKQFQIKWLKAGKELDPAKYPITHTDGVITIEIINSQPGDSGKYRCVATNDRGSDTSECVVIVEGEKTITQPLL